MGTPKTAASGSTDAAAHAGDDKQQYALLLSTVFQAADRTLKDEELQGWSQRIITAVTGLGGRLRG